MLEGPTILCPKREPPSYMMVAHLYQMIISYHLTESVLIRFITLR